jgi:hypothetical protein
MNAFTSAAHERGDPARCRPALSRPTSKEIAMTRSIARPAIRILGLALWLTTFGAAGTSAQQSVGVDLGAGGALPGVDVGTPSAPEPEDEQETDPAPAPAGAPRPRIVVLLHGMLVNAGDPGRLATGRGYWSFEFVQGILGGGRRAELVTLAGTRVRSHDEWVAEAEALPGAISEDAAGYAFAALPAGRTDSRDLLELSPIAAPTRADEPPPALSVMITARDASVGLLRQTQQASIQIEMLVRWFRGRYADYFDRGCRCEPELVLVGHSMGGLVSRVLMTNPTLDPRDTAQNPDGVVWSRAERRAMDFLRDRTVFVATLGTPHDGTLFADRGRAAFLAGVAGTAVAEAHVDAVFAALGESEAAAADAAGTLAALLPNAVRDLTRVTMTRLNRGILHPDRARRTLGADALLGPGAGGALVPIYTFGGRSPGGTHLDDFDVAGGVAGILAERPGDQMNIGLKIAIDTWMSAYPGGWGSLGGVFAGHAGALDRVARVDLEILAELADDFDVAGLDFPARLEVEAAGGLAAWLLEQAAAGGPGVGLPIYLREHYELSPLAIEQIPVPYLACDGHRLDLGVLDLPSQVVDAVAAALVGPLADALQEPTGLIELAKALGPAAWSAFLAALELEVARLGGPDLPAACWTPAGWSFAVEPGSVSLPVPVPTGAPTFDFEIDTDGAVSYDSAMGFLLGTAQAFAFDHTAGGAWHRGVSSPFEAEYHEGMNVRHHLGDYLHRELVTRAGPLAQ